VAIAAAAQTATSHLFAVRADGSVLGWGWNISGQVGTANTNAIVLPPAPVTGLNLN
jgi:alpha-tubulin suppressor-like RCC1 family protein